MGRSKSDMVALIADFEPVITEHLWKIWAYHASHRRVVNNWLVSLNKLLPRLRRNNVQKGDGRRKNVDREYLVDKLVIEPFESTVDLALLAHEYAEKVPPYPMKTNLTVEDVQSIQELARQYVDAILNDAGGLTIDFDKLSVKL